MKQRIRQTAGGAAIFAAGIGAGAAPELKEPVGDFLNGRTTIEVTGYPERDAYEYKAPKKNQGEVLADAFQEIENREDAIREGSQAMFRLYWEEHKELIRTRAELDSIKAANR